MLSDKIISFLNFYSHGCNLQLENVFAIWGGGGVTQFGLAVVDPGSEEKGA